MCLSHMASLRGMGTVLSEPRQQILVLFFFSANDEINNVFSSQILEDAEDSSLYMAFLSYQ